MLLATPLEVVTAPPPVVVQAYTESLCIDCKRFVENTLSPTYKKLGPTVIDLQIVPFGNAKIDKLEQTVTCQHGKAECDANSWEQCAVEQYQAPTYLEFIGCLEGELPMGSKDQPFSESIFSNCADSAGIEFSILKKCHDNPLMSWMLQLEYAKKTPADHTFVPWVLINGNFFDEEKDDFLQMICKEYSINGGSHPECDSVLGKNTPTGLN